MKGKKTTKTTKKTVTKSKSDLKNIARKYVSTNIGGFHSSRLDSLSRLSLKKILRRKNPYLFKAKNTLTSEEFVKYILDAHLSSQEETMFGDFLEGLAIHLCSEVYRGVKSSAEGIDLEFTKKNVRYIVAIKSGPHWGNSQAIKKMRANFKQARQILNTSRKKDQQLNITAVNGCCYGKENSPNKGDYYKYCGQEFWEFVSGDKDLYLEIIEPLGYKAKEKNEEFQEAYAQLTNRFTQEFSADFCTDFKIDWNKLVKFNSEMKQ